VSILLNWRVLAALALAGMLAFTHLTAYRKGEHAVKAEWDESVASANAESRRLEQARQRRADEAAQMAAQREARIRADAAHARASADSLRDDLRAANDYAKESRAAAERTAGVATELLGECSNALVDMGEAADRADSEARTLRQAWPK
jgi:hypothetical protein